MTWNTSQEVRKSKRWISVGDADQGNVRSFKYLGHVPSDNPKAPHYITQQMLVQRDQNGPKSNSVITDHEVRLSTRVRILEGMMRTVCSSNRDSQDGQPGQA